MIDAYSQGVVLISAYLNPPDPGCFVCGKNMISVKLNADKMTLRYFIAEVVKKNMNMCSPLIAVGPLVLYDDGEDDPEEIEIQEAQLNKQLKEKGMPSMQSCCCIYD